MALPITDYTAFFAGAKQAVQELEPKIKRKGTLSGGKREDAWRTS